MYSFFTFSRLELVRTLHYQVQQTRDLLLSNIPWSNFILHFKSYFHSFLLEICFDALLFCLWTPFLINFPSNCFCKYFHWPMRWIFSFLLGNIFLLVVLIDCVYTDGAFLILFWMKQYFFLGCCCACLLKRWWSVGLLLFSEKYIKTIKYAIVQFDSYFDKYDQFIEIRIL